MKRQPTEAQKAAAAEKRARMRGIAKQVSEMTDEQNADLLAALEIALPYVESFDDDNADLKTKANAEAVRAAIAKAKGEKS